MTTTTSKVRELRAQLGTPGLKTRRACDVRDILLCMQAAQKNARRRVRVYSDAGFVPNSYRHRCEIQYVEAIKIDDCWHYSVGWTGAQRSNARGSLMVVQ